LSRWQARPNIPELLGAGIAYNSTSALPTRPTHEAMEDATLNRSARTLTIIGIVLATLGVPQRATAHGGVVLEEDICVIKMGFLSAHFTIYQPESQANEEFCEDVPDVGNTVFVMEYLHESLRAMPLDFRIIRDVTEIGVFARWEDVAAIDDLDTATVFYAPPRIRRDATFTVEHRFDAPGWYIGIVTTRNPENGRTYETVFPFEVGANYGYLPLFVLLGLAAQLGYFVLTGTTRTWWDRLRRGRA